MRRRAIVAPLVLTLALGCQAVTPGGPTGTGSPKPRPATATSKPTGPAKPAEAVLRRVDQTAVARELTGKVKLISDHGGGIISNNSGAVVSNNGAAVIANNGAGVIANNGAAYRLTQAKNAGEALLAEAELELLDAAGRVLADASGKPITTRTGADGGYTLKAALPPEALVLRVKVAKAGVLPGGELRALVAKDAPTTAIADVDAAASLGASYVLASYVRGAQAVLDKLPAKEADGLRRAVGTALVDQSASGSVPDYAPEAQVAAVEKLRAGNAGVEASLKRIEAILLAGQKGLGAGLLATEVAIATPFALLDDGAGGLLVGEQVPGRVRRVKADGTMELFADPLAGTYKLYFNDLRVLRRGPDGALYAVETESNRIRKLLPDGKVEPVAGTGFWPTPTTPITSPASAMPMRPRALALRPGGGMVVADSASAGRDGRLLAIAADGKVEELAQPPMIPRDRLIVALEAAADGSLWALSQMDGEGPGQLGVLAKRAPDGTWTAIASDLYTGEHSSMARAADGTLYVSESNGHRVVRFAPDGTRALLAGTGVPGHTGDGGAATAAQVSGPSGLHLAPDGRLFVAERGGGVVRAIAPDGRIETYAGATGLVRVGKAMGIALASPGGVVIDPQGRVVVAELAGHTIKRLERGTLSLLYGGLAGFAGDGGPAAAARFTEPGGLAYGPDGALYVVDTGNARLRRIRPDGSVETLLGGAADAPDMALPGYNARPGTKTRVMGVGGVTVGPDGAAYMAISEQHVILRIGPDGGTRVIAGLAPTAGVGAAPGDQGDGGAARDARFSYPLGLAFRPGANPPELFVADSGNCRVRKIVDPGGSAPRVESVVGRSIVETALALTAGADRPGPQPVVDALLLLPTALAFDPAGDLYVAEAGSVAATARDMLPGPIDLGQLPQVPARLRKVSLARGVGNVSMIAGPGGKVLTGGGDDGLTFVYGMAFDAEGRLILSDTGANQLKLLPKDALE